MNDAIPTGYSGGYPPTAGPRPPAPGAARDGSRGSARGEARGTRSWRRLDARLLIGLGLVAASVLGMVAVVGASDRSVTVYAASGALAVGERVRPADLVERRVALGSLVQQYLTPETLPSEGVVVARTVADGELVPLSAVGSLAGVRLAPIVVTIAGQLPRAVVAGAIVDVWAVPAAQSGEKGSPVVVATAVSVLRVTRNEGIVAGGESVAVEVLVPRSRTARILAAKADGGQLSLVPVAVPVGG